MKFGSSEEIHFLNFDIRITSSGHNTRVTVEIGYNNAAYNNVIFKFG